MKDNPERIIVGFTAELGKAQLNTSLSFPSKTVEERNVFWLYFLGGREEGLSYRRKE